MPDLEFKAKNQGRTPRLGRALVIGAVILASLVGAGQRAEAAQFRVQSISIGRSTQYFRADRSVFAPRVFTQGMSLWGYDLLDDKTGSLNLHVSMRYTNDFSLDYAERHHPYFDRSWNELTLDLAYLDWRPYRALRLRLGRQWSGGALGARDFDGLLLRFSPRIAPATRAEFEGYAGRDIQSAYNQWFDPEHFDVQGLPIDPQLSLDGDSGAHLIAGASAGLKWGRDGAVALSWRRRWSEGVTSEALQSVSDSTRVVGSERVGVAGSASVHPRLVTSAWGVYNAPMRDVDRAGLQLAWRIPWLESSLSAGLEHQRPWFDSSSIFNLFGPRAHQQAFATYQHRAPGLDTDFQARAWGRYYPGSNGLNRGGDLRYAADDIRERAVGVSLRHLTRLRVWERKLTWSTMTSWQASLDRGSDQWMGQVQLRMLVWGDDLFVSARGLLLAATQDADRGAESGFIRLLPGAIGFASTGVIGLDLPVGNLGTLSASTVTSGGNIYPIDTSIYASFRVEHWP